MVTLTNIITVGLPCPDVFIFSYSWKVRMSGMLTDHRSVMGQLFMEIGLLLSQKKKKKTKCFMTC